MPRPSDLHIDAALSNFAVEIGKGGPFVADQLFPVVEVNKESDKYWSYPVPELSDSVPQLRTAGGLAQEVDWKPTTATYSCEEYALRRLISNRARDNADNPQKLENNTVRKLLHQIRLGVEKRIKAMVMSTSYITNYSTPSVKWDAASGTITIEKNIDTAKEAVLTQCGYEPNVILIPPAVAKVMKRDSTIRDLIKYTNSDLLINGDLPPTVFGLRVIVPGAIENTANPAQTQSLARIWSTDNVLVAFVDDTADDTESYTLGKQFRAKLDAEAGDQRFAVWRYYEAARHGWWIEAGVLQDEKLVSGSAGYLLTDVLT